MQREKTREQVERSLQRLIREGAVGGSPAPQQPSAVEAFTRSKRLRRASKAFAAAVEANRGGIPLPLPSGWLPPPQ